MTLSETAFAKLNLALHVRRRRADGYHEIETIFAFADFGDVLTAAPADKFSLVIKGPFGSGLDAGDDNLVLRAARALAQHSGIDSGAALTLDKQLPVASGIGGGSADAAATLRLLDRLWGLDAGLDELARIGVSLGADVPACVHSRTARGEGVGGTLGFPDPGALPGMNVLLVNPGVAVSTASVFAAWDGIDRGMLDTGPLLAAACAGRNDLQAPATAICPEIHRVLSTLRSFDGTQIVRLSGSGATCFALFRPGFAVDATLRAVAWDPCWWVRTAQLR